MILWIIPNLGLLSRFEPFDPYPFGGLSFFITFESILLSIIVLCGQNVQAASGKIRNDIEFEANLNSELAIRNMHTRIGDLHDEVISRLYEIEKRL